MMPVIEHQALIYYNVLSYETIIEENQIPEMIVSIKHNISVLGFKICGNILITKKGLKTEFLIPVDRSFCGNAFFKFKPAFKLMNAARLRHYGSFGLIEKSVEELKSYLIEKKLCAVTDPYFVDKDIENDVIDIYIGLSQNIL